MSQPLLSPPPVFSEAGAQDNTVVVREAQEWIEEVTGQRFGSSFKESLKDGVLLCELMKRINPGSISKINKLKSPIAHLDNIQQFLNACRELGMKDSQLFDMMDLQVSQNTPRKAGVKRDDADRKIRSVCVTLYWLGRTVADMEDYRGPQLDLSAFTGLVDETQYSDEESNGSLIVDPPEHYQLEVGNHLSSPDQPPSGTVENGMGLTFEQEQTADQLLADIQSAVDEMLHDFQSGYMPEETPRKPEIPTTPKAPDTPSRMGVSVHMISRNGGFGFQVVGGADANYFPEVELVLPGSAAEDAGIQPKDKIVSVNKEDVTRLSHVELVALIKKAGSEGSMLIGLIRNGPEPVNQMDTTSDNEELELSINSDDLQDPEELKSEYPAASTSQEPTITPYVHGQPLPPLVEYQEETMLEQITELYEKSPPPPDTPSPPPTRSTASHPAPVSDDRESIERDLQEIVLMEMAATTEQKQKAKDSGSSDGETGELEDQIEELLSFGRASKSPQEELHLQVNMPPPLFESPPPPMPTTEAPKRQLKNFESPPPVKAKPKRPLSFVEATRLPQKDSEPERAKSATPTKTRLTSPPPPTTPSTKSPSPVVTVKPVETVQTVDTPSLQPAPVTIGTPSPQPASVNTPSPQPVQAMNSPTPEPLHTDSPPTKLPLQAKSNTPSPAQASPIASTPRSYASPVIPSSESEQVTQVSPEPVTPVSQAKEIGVISPDDVEIVGNVKIHRVQRTRWTPKGSSTEMVMTSPDEQNSQKYRQHYTKLLPKLKDLKQQTPPATQNGYPEPTATVQQISPMNTAPLRTSPGTGRAHDQQKRYTQPAGLASWQMPLDQEDNTFSQSSRELPQQQSPQRRTNWRSQEELRIKKNVATTPNDQQNSLWMKIPTSRQVSMPYQSTQHQQQYNKTQSLPRGMENWRVNRTHTWSRGTTTQRPTDGQQSAFAIKPKSPYDLCSRCHKPLGTDTVMSIPNLRVSYHMPCFICRVCRAPLVRSPHNTVVIIKGMHPHCKYCGSNDQGVLTTEC